MSSRAYGEDLPERCDLLRPTAAWRSAWIRRCNARTALAFWLFNVLLVLYAALSGPWTLLQHLRSA